MDGRLLLIEKKMTKPKLSEIANTYSLILCDIWGVVHNGNNIFPDAINTLLAYLDAGGDICLITNAPRRSEIIRDYLFNMGVERNICNNIVSSGDCSYSWLSSIGDRPLFHIGPEKDNSLFAGLDLKKVSEFDCLECICTGFFNEYIESIGDYQKILETLLERGIVIHCANPDLYVNKGSIRLPCAGLIAQSYSQMGGEVVYFGKPHSYIYDLALEKVLQSNQKSVSKDSILAIGDGLNTDIAGATNFGIDSLFIINGVHEAEFKKNNDMSEIDIESVKDYINKYYSKIAIPKYVMNSLNLL
jgi:HAD superfamily hydrolase (TIGR01459 family)